MVDGVLGGFLVGQHNGVILTLREIYELATSKSLMSWYARDEAAALRELTAVLGPLPEEWVDSLGE